MTRRVLDNKLSIMFGGNYPLHCNMLTLKFIPLCFIMFGWQNYIAFYTFNRDFFFSAIHYFDGEFPFVFNIILMVNFPSFLILSTLIFFSLRLLSWWWIYQAYLIGQTQLSPHSFIFLATFSLLLLNAISYGLLSAIFMLKPNNSILWLILRIDTLILRFSLCKLIDLKANLPVSWMRSHTLFPLRTYPFFGAILLDLHVVFSLLLLTAILIDKP